MRFLTRTRSNTVNQALKQALLLGTIHFKPLYLVFCSYGFKIPRWQQRAGSSPAPGTNQKTGSTP